MEKKKKKEQTQSVRSNNIYVYIIYRFIINNMGMMIYIINFKSFYAYMVVILSIYYTIDTHNIYLKDLGLDLNGNYFPEYILPIYFVYMEKGNSP